MNAALAFADESGLEALSMRKLAQELGVEAMSLYNHVANKEDLVEGILDLVADQIAAPAEEDDWKAALRESAVAAHDAFRRHRWAAGIWMTRGGASTPRMKSADSVLRTFREAGFSEDLTYHAFHTFQSYVIGFTLQELNFRVDREQLKVMAARFLREFPAADYPYLAEHVRQHMEPSDEHASTFEFGLDLILDGLERLRDGS